MSTNRGIVNRSELGRFGEYVTEVYLTRCLGWRVLDRNVRTKYGEIDLVARSAYRYQFIEVKTRSGKQFGSPIEAVSELKLARLYQQIEYYLYKQKISPNANYALDVVGIVVRHGQIQDFQHVKVLP